MLAARESGLESRATQTLGEASFEQRFAPLELKLAIGPQPSDRMPIGRQSRRALKFHRTPFVIVPDSSGAQDVVRRRYKTTAATLQSTAARSIGSRRLARCERSGRASHKLAATNAWHLHCETASRKICTKPHFLSLTPDTKSVLAPAIVPLRRSARATLRHSFSSSLTRSLRTKSLHNIAQSIDCHYNLGNQLNY